jgi:hypothetical protein
MSKVYIKNENHHPLKQLFRGEEVLILAKDYWRDKSGNKRAFDIYEANDFRGTYMPAPIDTDGKRLDDPRYYKIISMEPVSDEKEEAVEPRDIFKCMAPGCRHVAKDGKALDKHVEAMHGNIETLILPEEDVKVKKAK